MRIELSSKDCCSSELIDTLWNVNQIDYDRLAQVLKELIDTLWNVNK